MLVAGMPSLTLTSGSSAARRPPPVHHCAFDPEAGLHRDLDRWSSDPVEGPQLRGSSMACERGGATAEHRSHEALPPRRGEGKDAVDGSMQHEPSASVNSRLDRPFRHAGRQGLFSGNEAVLAGRERLAGPVRIHAAHPNTGV